MDVIRKKVDDVIRKTADNKWKTVFVKNLPLITAKSDIRVHFGDLLQIDTVVVGPLVPYIKKIRDQGADGKVQAEFAIGTTVAFPAVPRWQENLNGKPFTPGNVPWFSMPEFDIDVKEELVGLFGLEQHDRESELYSHEFE
jgi:RNA recognition motif-containing protein